MPTMPHEMSNLNSQDLGNYMSNYAAWREFTEDVLTQSNMEYLEAKEAYDLRYKQLWLTQERLKTVKDSEKNLEINPEIVDLREKLLKAQMFNELIGTKYESINNAITVLSREITRRQGRKYED